MSDTPQEPAAEDALSDLFTKFSWWCDKCAIECVGQGNFEDALRTAYQRGRLAGREEAAQLCEMTAAQIRLMCGELTAGEMRSVRSVLTSRAAAIRSCSLPQEGG